MYVCCFCCYVLVAVFVVVCSIPFFVFVLGRGAVCVVCVCLFVLFC